jgi:hypothetical protein
VRLPRQALAKRVSPFAGTCACPAQTLAVVTHRSSADRKPQGSAHADRLARAAESASRAGLSKHRISAQDTSRSRPDPRQRFGGRRPLALFASAPRVSATIGKRVAARRPHHRGPVREQIETVVSPRRPARPTWPAIGGRQRHRVSGGRSQDANLAGAEPGISGPSRPRGATPGRPPSRGNDRCRDRGGSCRSGAARGRDPPGRGGSGAGCAMDGEGLGEILVRVEAAIA